MSDQNVTVTLTQQQDYQFKIEFGATVPAILGDEPTPLGQGMGPLTQSVGQGIPITIEVLDASGTLLTPLKS